MKREKNSSIYRFVDSSIGRMTGGRGISPEGEARVREARRYAGCRATMLESDRATLAVVRLLSVAAAVFAVLAAKAYTALDYSRDGLLHQWDAIANVNSYTRSATATVWKDLAGDLDFSGIRPAAITVSAALHRVSTPATGRFSAGRRKRSKRSPISKEIRG